MKTSPSPWRLITVAGLVAGTPLAAGERRVVAGYAQQSATGPLLLSLTPAQGTVLRIPSAPTDRDFTPPADIRWEVEMTGYDPDGVRTANALSTALDDFMWPAGEEISPDRYQGSLDGMFPSDDVLNPLDVAPGSGIPDYDQDGTPDSSDAFPGDPNESADTDGDGIGDNADPDDDNDGIPDVWETAHGTDPLVNDAARDPDGDGYSNYAEYEADTDPFNRNSCFRIERVESVSPTQAKVYWNVALGRTYSIMHSPVLGRPEVLQSGISSTTSGLMSVTLPKSSLTDFYYLQVTVTPAKP